MQAKALQNPSTHTWRVKMNIRAGENVEQAGLYPGYQSENWLGRTATKAKHYAPYDSVISLLVIEPTEMRAHVH